MGYRSDVGIVVKAKHKEKFAEAIAAGKHPLGRYCDIIENEDNTVHVEFEDIKWYDTYEEIKHLMDFLKTLPENDYGFLRIGEDPEDMEMHGIPYDLGLSISRKLVWY